MDKIYIKEVKLKLLQEVCIIPVFLSDLNWFEDEQPEREQGVPAGADDRSLHRGGAHPLPHQHHQQGPGEGAQGNF